MLASPCWLGDAFCALIVPSLPLSRGGGMGQGHIRPGRVRPPELPKTGACPHPPVLSSLGPALFDA